MADEVALSIGGGRKLTAWLASQRNKPLEGTVRVAEVPDGWTALAAKTFKNLEAAGTERVDFDLGNASFRNMAEYPVSIVVESGDEFVRTDSVLRPVFAQAAKQAIRADGRLDDWEGADWIELGAQHLSKVFDGNQRHTGAADFSARFAAAWTPEALALAVVVTDDRHFTVEAPTLAWQGDSVQVYFDPRNDAMPERRNVEDDIEYLLRTGV